MTPRISVIIPALNEEKLLPGLLSQFTDEVCARHSIEVIVSDGGSSDRTLEIAASFGVSVVRSCGEERQTIAGGRNSGAKAAHGDMLVFINADVRIAEPDRLFGEAARTLSLAGISGATSVIRVFPEEERPADRLFSMIHTAYVRFLNLVGDGMGRGECQIVTREMFEKTGGYNSAMIAGEDYDFFRRVRKHGKIAVLSGVIVHESPRRFRKYGYLPILWEWTRNAFSVIVKQRSASHIWEQVR